MMISVIYMEENIVEKEEICWLPAFFFFFYNVFEKLLPKGGLTLSSIYTHFNTLKKKA